MAGVRNIPSLLAARVEESPDSVAHWTMDAAGRWIPTTWRDYWKKSALLATGLHKLGLQAGMKVGIMAHTSQAWEFLQMAILMCGGVVVGIDPHDRNENINEISVRTDLAGIVLENSTLLDKLSEGVADKLLFMVCLSESADPGHADKTVTLDDLLGAASQEGGAMALTYELSGAPATIIFTSGTTGTPKGIAYTHEQVIFACESILEAFNDLGAESHLVCWLPLSNLFQRMVNFCGIRKGASTYFVENPREVVKCLPLVDPHIFIGVPRFFEKLRQGVIDVLAQGPRWTRVVMDWAIGIGDSYACALRERETPPILTTLSYKLVASFLLARLRRAIFGSNLRYMISGSAPMPQWLLEWFHSLGVVILEAYGISENIIPIAMNRPSSYEFGSVGMPLSGNDVTLAGDGELLVRGKGVFSGYYGDDSSQETRLQDGLLATGDYARMDENGFIYLTGRKSDIFKTSTGRRIAPVAIENCILQVPYVENAVVFGAGKKFLVAILSISLPHLSGAFGEEHEKDAEKNKISSKLCNKIIQDVSTAVRGLPKYQQPVALFLVTDPFTVDGGELTSNLKVRRKNIERKYGDDLEGLYAKLETSEKITDMIVCGL